MRVLVVGSGAREHAIVRSLLAEEGVDHVVAAPGNPGMAAAGAECRDHDPVDVAGVAELAVGVQADLVVVGPEAPLVAGVADAVRAAGIPCFGPSAAAARLEASKAFAKEVMADAGVATARPRVCRDLAEVEAALDELGAPHVVKDDGLAAGKGVVVTDSREVALAHARACLEQPHSTVVVEEYLDGPELSVFCVCDGRDVVALPPAQDFKRLRDGGQGPNTGGMGAYSPVPWLPEGVVDDVVEHVARPVLAEMDRRGTPFTGVLYCGLALTAEGIRVVEFNVRLGDPEAQVVLARLGTPLGHLLLAAAQGRLAEHVRAAGGLRESAAAAVGVVLAAAGYPESPRTGDAVLGLESVDDVAGAHVLHAGTAVRDGHVVTAGGRVVTVVGTGADVAAARDTAYRAVERVHVPGGQLRLDVAAGV
ncbi:phosphoribosylamine--glycine ligase [Aquipuribacter nitratireducens]|uniref:Phosphoribosylamine--glycine ligase n=1 Tax=Aquipuribacter nitratireducens TaxID=650104 RepID=A0ABW0GPM2_9MICO